MLSSSVFSTIKDLFTKTILYIYNVFLENILKLKMQSTSAPKGKRKRGKKSKSQTKDATQKTKLSRNEIGANWKAFLST